MSRRTIVVLAIFLVALLVTNIVILAVWLPGRKVSAAGPGQTQTAAAPVQNSAPPPAVAANNPPPAAGQPVAAAAAPNPQDFAVERQFLSTSGNLRVKYLRDRKTKMRRIVVEDARRPGAMSVLWESKRPGWALVSPDDQWIAVDERSATNDGGVRLFHRSGDTIVPDDTTADGKNLQDSVWNVYLSATQNDPNTPRRGVTLDATAWEGDSHKLNISVAYLPTSNNPEVPAPWSCVYNVASKKVEQIPDQPSANGGNSDASNEPAGNQSSSDDQQGATAASSSAAGNPFANGGPNSEADQGGNADGDAESTEFPGEHFPATRLDELNVPDVSDSSLSEINYAINEMFARHGAEFKDKKVTDEFSKFSWYKPRAGLSFDDIEKEFSDLEKANLKVLGRCRDAKLAAAHHKSRPAHGENSDGETTGEKVMRGIRAWQDAGAPLPPHP